METTIVHPLREDVNPDVPDTVLPINDEKKVLVAFNVEIVPVEMVMVLPFMVR